MLSDAAIAAVMDGKRLRAWAREQAEKRGDERYDYNSVFSCYLSDYFRSCGWNGGVWPESVVVVAPRTGAITYVDLPAEWDALSKGCGREDVWTFGAAYARLREAGIGA